MNQEQVIEMFDVLILCQTNTLIYIWGFFSVNARRLYLVLFE